MTIPATIKDFGDFSPPSDYEFEPEFHGRTPRLVPDKFRHGSYNRRWRRNLILWPMTGLFFIAVSFTESFDDIRHYILPLVALPWIGLGLLLIAFFCGLYFLFSQRRFKYIIHGQPIVMRVTGIRPIISQDPNFPQAFYQIDVEYIHPKTGERKTRSYQTPMLGQPEKVMNIPLALRIGDYVTGVYLPGELLGTLELYPLMGLNPDIHFIEQQNLTHAKKETFLAFAGQMLGAFAFLAMIGYCLYLMMIIHPIGEAENQIPLFSLIGGLILTVPLVAGLRVWFKKRQGKPLNILKASFFSLFFGSLLLFPSLSGMNCLLDHSAPRYVPVRIIQYWQVTHNFIMREYEIEYQNLETGVTEKMAVSFRQLEALADSDAAQLEIYRGAFGWEYIRRIVPGKQPLAPSIKRSQGDYS